MVEEAKDKKITELEHIIYIHDVTKRERECSDKKYAIKLVQDIVFAMVGLALLAVISALIALVVM